MGRWEPDARARLERAALELYSERGFEQTTVGEIAQRAGLTERTFFRHFGDKREVLFGGADYLNDLLRRSIGDAPDTAAPMSAVTSALEAIGVVLEGRHELARRRQTVIDAHPVLQERELIKLASLASTLAEALQARGVPEPAASLAAQAGIAAFKIAFMRWIGEDADADLARIIRESIDQLRVVTSSR